MLICDQKKKKIHVQCQHFSPAALFLRMKTACCFMNFTLI